MSVFELSFQADFYPELTQQVLAAIAPVLGGSPPPLPPELVRSTGGDCGVWRSEAAGTVLRTEIALGQGNPREGYPREQEHRLELPVGSVVAKAGTLTLLITSHSFRFTDVPADAVVEARAVMAELLGPRSDNNGAYDAFARQLVSAGHVDLARPVLEQCVAHAKARGRPARTHRSLYLLARSHGVHAPDPGSPADDPLPELSPAQIAMLVGFGKAETLVLHLARGLTPAQITQVLREAAESDRTDLVEVLLSNGLGEEDRQMALGRAARAGSVGVTALLASASSPSPRDFLEACERGTPEVLEAMVGAGADIEVEIPVTSRSGSAFWKGIRRDGHTPLMTTVHAREPEHARVLLEHGADANRLTRGWRMPLDVARYLKDFAMAKVLEAAGARGRREQDIPLAGAIHWGDDARAEALFAHASPEDLDAAFVEAARSGSARWVGRLVPEDRERVEQVFDQAVAAGWEGTVSALAGHVDLAQRGWRTAGAAVRADQPTVIAALHRAGVNLFNPPEHALPLLHEAVRHGAARAVEALILRGVDTTAIDGEGKTAREHAERHRSKRTLVRALEALDRPTAVPRLLRARTSLREQHGEFTRPRWRFRVLGRVGGLDGHRFGGPVTMPHPSCDCGAPLSLLVQLHLDALPMPNRGSGWVQVLGCSAVDHLGAVALGCVSGLCARALIIRVLPPGTELRASEHPTPAGWRIEGFLPPQEDWPWANSDLPETVEEQTREVFREAADTGSGDKVGGFAFSGFGAPSCDCGAAMHLLIQLGTQVLGWSHGSADGLALYQCPDHLDRFALNCTRGLGHATAYPQRQLRVEL